jgi:CRP/FNR family transcriptional regulator, cyclic AMP receptor protein
VRLLDADPDLARGLSGDELAMARRELVVPGHRVPAGRWIPEPDLSRAIGVLVVDGMLLRDRCGAGAGDVHLFGPGDLFDPRLLGDDGSWRALVTTHVAMLDAGVAIAARRWPQILPALTQRLFDGHHESHRLAEIRTLPRVHSRVVALLSHLAGRWGHVTADGIALALPVTHEQLGRLVGAQRPTVSLALTDLREDGSVIRLDDGRWLLGASARTEVPA